MTIIEAIEIINREKKHCEAHLNDSEKADEYYKEMNEFVEAYDMAIKALERMAPPDCESVTNKERTAEPCEDCISRESVLDLLQNETVETYVSSAGREEHTIAEINVDALKSLPSVTPARKKGKWITIHEDEEDEPAAGFFRCSCCKDELYDITKYCPSCGSYNGG